MLNITKGKIDRAQKTVIYGPEGIGKTTIAAQFPDPIVIDTEGGTAFMDVRRIEKPGSWDELLSIIKEVAATPGICKTLVIDTADWAEQLIVTYLCNKYKQNSIESFGYGKGYTYLAEEFARLLSACDQVIAAGINVTITAHDLGTCQQSLARALRNDACSLQAIRRLWIWKIIRIYFRL